MQAHLRTEAALKSLHGMKLSAKGCTNESWPLYFGYYDLKNDDRKEIAVAGDGLISWTSIADLGLATALILADVSSKWEGRTLYHSASKPASLQEISKIVSKVKGKVSA